MIYFVGAGPGAVDLITIKGRDLLNKADVVVYAGSLVNPELLNYCKSDCKIYNSAEMTLEEIVTVMAENDSPNNVIVRLHTGDPSIFGAIREQMDLLDEKNITYQSVPGVSSFLAAAASLKAEFTLPTVSQTVILTRMEGRTPVPAKQDIKSLAEHNATMVIFLSVSMLKNLSEELLAGGYLKETPVAIVYKASWADEKIIRTTVEKMHLEAGDIKKTALVMVGGFLDSDYERSKLYDGSFTHEFRKACSE